MAIDNNEDWKPLKGWQKISEVFTQDEIDGFKNSGIVNKYVLDRIEIDPNPINNNSGWRAVVRTVDKTGYVYIEMPRIEDVNSPKDSIKEFFNGDKTNIKIKYGKDLTAAKASSLIDIDTDDAVKTPIEYTNQKTEASDFAPPRKSTNLFVNSIYNKIPNAKVQLENGDASIRKEYKVLLGKDYASLLEMLPENGDGIYTSTGIRKFLDSSSQNKSEAYPFVEEYNLNNSKKIDQKIRGDFAELNFFHRYQQLIKSGAKDAIEDKKVKSITSPNLIEIDTKTGKYIFSKKKNIDKKSDFIVTYEDGSVVEYEIKNSNLDRISSKGTFAVTDLKSLEYFAERGYNPIDIKKALQEDRPLTQKDLGKQSKFQYDVKGNLTNTPRTKVNKRFIYIGVDVNTGKPETRIYDPIQEAKKGNIIKTTSYGTGEGQINLCSAQVNKLPLVD
jgi:hypothetical protein